jgi:hypothetical protein
MKKAVEISDGKSEFTANSEIQDVTLDEENTTPSPARSRTISGRLFWLMISVIAILSFSLFAHIRIVNIGEEYTGWLAPFDFLFNLSLSWFFIILNFCVGRRVGNIFDVQFVNLAEELSFSIMLGVGVVGLLIFLLGVLGAFQALPMGILVITLLVFTRQELARVIVIAESLIHGWSDKGQKAVVFLFFVLMALLVMRAATPPYAVDDAICHLAVPQAFIKAGGIIPLYDNFPGNMPLLTHMMYVVFLMAKADIAARLFSLGLAVATAFAIYTFCKRFIDQITGILALFAFFSAGVILEVAISNRIDVTVAGMIFLATYAMINYLETNQSRWLWYSAIFSGFSLSIKYTAAIWIAFIGVMYAYESLFRKRQKFVLFLKRGAIFTIIMVAIVSPWLIKNYVYYQNPFYPFITGEVADYGTQGIRYFTAADEQRMDEYFNQSKSEIPEIVGEIEQLMARRAGLKKERHPLRVWEYFTKSDLYNMGDAESSHSPNYLFVLIPLILFLPKRRWLVWFGIFCIGFFLFVASSSWLGRYQVPLYPAATVLVAYVLGLLAKPWRWSSIFPKELSGAVVAVSLLLTLDPFVAQTYKMDAARFLIGAFSRREFMKPLYYYPAIDYINYNSPSDAKIMLMGVQTGYHLQRNYIADPAWDSVEWQRLLLRHLSLEGIYQDLQQQGVNYIAYNPGLYSYIAGIGRAGSGPAGTVYSSPYAPKEPDYQVQLRNWATFELFRSKYLELVFERSGNLVFKVK